MDLFISDDVNVIIIFMKLKEKYNKIKQFIIDNDISLYFSIAATLAMVIIHLVNVILHYSNFLLFYVFFYFFLLLTKVWLYFDNKRENSNPFLIGTIMSFIILIPLLNSLIFTIKDRDKPVYFFDFMIYGYAFYAFFKLIVSIVNYHNSKSNNNVNKRVYSYFSLLSAFLTLNLMQFALIMTFSENNNHGQLLSIEITTQILAVLFNIYVFMFCLINEIKYIKNKKNENIIEK